ncbi:MAG: glycosyltransferase [Chloroflexi bacterium]|nr:glycosyltransferase [Chloroflexota bacterium]
MSGRSLRIVLLSKVRLNPYVQLLRRGLLQADEDLSVSVEPNFSLPWILRHRRDVDLLHLHWLELLFDYPDRQLRLKRAISVGAGLLAARMFGIKLVYTVHNLAQHERRYPLLNALANRLVFRLAGAVHVHDETARQEVVRRFGHRSATYVAPHGHYATWYPNHIGREEARQQLGLPADAFVYLFLGLIRPYKGLETLLEAFGDLHEEKVRLVIAGHIAEPAYLETLTRQARRDPRILLRPGYVPDDEVQVFCNAADVSVLPYRDVTTSGAAWLAFSFSLPIVAPNRPPFRDLVADGRGLGYDAAHVQGLTLALQQAQALDGECAQAAIRRFLERYDWRSIAMIHATVYHRLVAPPSS